MTCKLPKGTRGRLRIDKVARNVYSVSIYGAGWQEIKLFEIEARNAGEAKAKAIEKICNTPEIYDKVIEIMYEVKKREYDYWYNRIKKAIEEGEFRGFVWELWEAPVKVLRDILREEGFDVTGMTREEMIKTLEGLIKATEPVYIVHTRRFKQYTPEGFIEIYEEREYSDGTRKVVKVETIIPPDWRLIGDRIVTERELLSGMWAIEVCGIDEWPDLIKDREYYVDLIKRIEYQLYSEGRDPTYILIQGGRKPWERGIRPWSVSARLLPEVEGGGGGKEIAPPAEVPPA